MFEFETPLGTGKLKLQAQSIEEVYLLLNKMGVLGDKQLFSRMHDMSRLPIPSVCPIDGSPVRLVMREAGSGARRFTAYEVISTGTHRFRMSLGSHADPEEGKELFVKEADGWTYWDREREEQRIVFQYGHIIHKNLPTGFVVPPEQAALYPDGEVVTKDGQQQSYSAPQQAAKPAPAAFGDDRRTKAQLYLIELAERAGVPKAKAWQAYSVYFTDEGITGNASLDVSHAEQIYKAVQDEDEASIGASLKSALEFAQENPLDEGLPESMPF